MSCTEDQALEFIKTHYDIHLTKIEENWDAACKMYTTNVSFCDAINIYKQLSLWFTNVYKKN